ncbi:Dolichol-phosphate mannosyltransferase subunit 3 [Anthophora quadrimaculata]
MTKLTDWLLFASLFFSIWIAVITGSVSSSFVAEWQQVILFFPLIVLFAFGLYASVTILYRVLTFYNCENAAIELQEQIEEAKKDLQSKGVILKGN